MSKFLILLFCVFLSCSSPQPRSKPLVVTTTTMLTDAVRIVGGDDIEVIGLMGPGVDPHLFKATQTHLRALHNAELIFFNGLLLEGKLAELLEKLQHKAFPVSSAIPDSSYMRPSEFKGAYDPHLWFDVHLWKEILPFIAERLTILLPENAEQFNERATAYYATLDSLDTYVSQRIQEIPEQRRIMITAHDAFGYFGRRYGIQVRGLQGISTISEFGLRDITQLSDVILREQIPAVFIESSVPRRSIEALVQGVRARGGQLVIGGELFSDAMGHPDTPEGTYIGMVRHNVDTIVNALTHLGHE